ncbi:MAG: hypothetical protein MJE68_26685, partial [Proteobacteria bacterium]|nr:hypothetical protein [Pseudomonadota bacterium]
AYSMNHANGRAIEVPSLKTIGHPSQTFDRSTLFSGLANTYLQKNLLQADHDDAKHSTLCPTISSSKMHVSIKFNDTAVCK